MVPIMSSRSTSCCVLRRQIPDSKRLMMTAAATISGSSSLTSLMYQSPFSHDTNIAALAITSEAGSKESMLRLMRNQAG